MERITLQAIGDYAENHHVVEDSLYLELVNRNHKAIFVLRYLIASTEESSTSVAYIFRDDIARLYHISTSTFDRMRPQLSDIGVIFENATLPNSTLQCLKVSFNLYIFWAAVDQATRRIHKSQNLDRSYMELSAEEQARFTTLVGVIHSLKQSMIDEGQYHAYFFCVFHGKPIHNLSVYIQDGAHGIGTTFELNVIDDEKHIVEQLMDIYQKLHTPPSPIEMTREEMLRNELKQSHKAAILKRDNYTCQHCGIYGKNNDIKLHIDHIIPITRGGDNSEDNLQVLCESCNLKKGNKLESELSS